MQRCDKNTRVCQRALFATTVGGKCIDEKTDLSAYDENRKLLYNSLSKFGFQCVKPQGAFYLFVKCPIDENEFVSKAKSYNILVVGGKSFGCEGYVRIAILRVAIK